MSSLRQDGIGVLQIQGPIKKGDAERLQQKLEAAPGYYYVVTMDSPGGNMLEGIAIGRVLGLQGLAGGDPRFRGAFVLKGERCLSACALAFAMSKGDHAELGWYGPFVESGAQLGFHMASLQAEQAALEAPVADVMNLTYQVVTEFAHFIKGNLNPPQLFLEALKHEGPDDFYMLRGRFRSVEMGFVPVAEGLLADRAKTVAMTVTDLKALCILFRSTKARTMHSWAYEFDLPSVVDMTAVSDAMAAGGGSHIVALEGDASCEFRAGENQTLEILYSLTGENIRAGITVGVLAELYGCPDGVLHQGKVRRRHMDFTGHASEPWIPDWEVEWNKTVLRDVNMRSGPGLNNAVVAGLMQGMSVQVTGCRLLPDTQSVWFQVQSERGAGWISAGFTEPGFIVRRPVHN